MSDKDDIDSACRQCEGSRYQIGRQGEFAFANRCTCASPCASCNDTGLSVREVDGEPAAYPCDCKHLDRRIALFNDAAIPAKFANVWVEDLDDVHSSQKQLKYALLKYRDEYSSSDPGYLLWGSPGVGKTHLLCGLVGYLAIERGISCRFIDFIRLVMDLKQAYAQGKWDSDVISPLLQVDVLVIDELGKGRNSDFELGILDQLISSRYNAMKTIHCTSNYPLESRRKPEERQYPEGVLPSATLKDRVGERIYSRLNEMCRFNRIEGKDYRKLSQRRLGRKQK